METITGSDWAEDARAWAMENGISDGTNPMSPVTREQLEQGVKIRKGKKVFHRVVLAP